MAVDSAAAVAVPVGREAVEGEACAGESPAGAGVSVWVGAGAHAANRKMSDTVINSLCIIV
ncbi:MAG: hypothetical protein LLG42_01255 [Chloroflexi bacterium]|nr:hypothetical protein [Chloroflexota bacterium]